MFKKWYVISVVYNEPSTESLHMKLYRQRLSQEQVEQLDRRLRIKKFNGEVAIYRIVVEDDLAPMQEPYRDVLMMPLLKEFEELAVAA